MEYIFEKVEKHTNIPRQDFSLGLVIFERGFRQTVGFISVQANVVQMVSAFILRKGYGSLLLNEAEQQIKQNGYSHVFLTAYPAIRPFYIRNGYRDMTVWDNFWYRNSYNMMKALI